MSEYNALDLGLRRSLRLRTVRRWALLVVLLGTFVEYQGLLHVRLSFPGQERAFTPDYWSLTGKRRYAAPNAPLFALLPMERSVLSYASEGAREAWNWTAEGASTLWSKVTESGGERD